MATRTSAATVSCSSRLTHRVLERRALSRRTLADKLDDRRKAERR